MKHCIACGKLLPEASLFELTSAPASAQDIPDAASVQQDKGVTLQLRQCSGCGLVQFDCEPVPYYRDGSGQAAGLLPCGSCARHSTVT